tara:strand:- start:1598 stop:2188 length:591 start_codon:yes stop_codon:yes gene_type:complete
VDNGDGRLTLKICNIFVLAAAIIFLYSCEIEESKNIYKPPLVETPSKMDIVENTFTNKDLISIGEELSKIFNTEIDIFSESTVRFEGEEITNYIDCGFMNNEIYVKYIDRIFGSYLEAVIAFTISNQDNLYKISNEEIKYIFYSKETGTRWRFKSDKPKELLVGNPVYSDNPYRICLSKNVLENKIIDILKKASNV